MHCRAIPNYLFVRSKACAWRLFLHVKVNCLISYRGKLEPNLVFAGRKWGAGGANIEFVRENGGQK